jgi:hypothetical protein
VNANSLFDLIELSETGWLRQSPWLRDFQLRCMADPAWHVSNSMSKKYLQQLASNSMSEKQKTSNTRLEKWWTKSLRYLLPCAQGLGGRRALSPIVEIPLQVIGCK